MKLNEFSRRAGSRTTRKRVGRGASAGQGKTCGLGHKGQGSRSGSGPHMGFEGGQLPLQRRIPTFGFRSRVSRVTAEVRVHELARIDGDTVSLNVLKQAGIVSKNIKRASIIKSGELTRALKIQGLHVTKGAREMIEAAGGSVEA